MGLFLQGATMTYSLPNLFDLHQHFDRSHPDIRVQTRELFERTKKTVAKEREISLEVVLLIGCLEVKNAAVNLGFGLRENLAKGLGLTPNMYWKRAQAGRALLAHPQFIDLILTGKTHISHVAMIAPKLNGANREVYLAEIPGKSERQVRELIGTINKDGSRNTGEPTFDLRLTFTKSQMAQLDRAREVLSANGRRPSQEDVLMKSIHDLLEKRDPLRKAKRAAKRLEKRKEENQSNFPSSPKDLAEDLNNRPLDSQKSTTSTSFSLKTLNSQVIGPQTKVRFSLAKGRQSISAEIQHQVFLRDDGRCIYVEKDGLACDSRHGIQIDHIIPVSQGGTNDLDNLRLLCREHNLMEANRLLGEQVMGRYGAGRSGHLANP
jgi:hypothetical protein